MAVVCRRHLSILLSFFLLFPPCFSQPSPSAALLKFKKSFTNSDSLYNWKDDGSNPCDPNGVWVGIICSDGEINSINLSGMDLHGQPDVGSLEVIDGIKAISLENNSLVGPMPEINRLGYLKAFYGGSNWFSGVIPSDFFQTLGSLKKLWLQHNNFTGQIPISIAELPNLKELHLEYNEFSGPIPQFPEADIITTLDLSNNKLEGEIPSSLKKFDAKVFANNADLCGSKLSKECPEPTPQPVVEPSRRSRTSTLWIILVVIVALLIFIILIKANQMEEDDKRHMNKGNMKEAVVNIPPITKTQPNPMKNNFNNNNNINKTNNNNNNNNSGVNSKNTTAAAPAPMAKATTTTPNPAPAPVPAAAAAPAPATTNNNGSGSSSNNNNVNTNVVKENKDATTRPAKKGGLQQKGLVPGPLPGKSMGDLVMVNEERGIFGLSDLMKAAAEVLGNGGLGSAYKATLGSGVSVVVKRVREMNPLTKEVFDAEMKKLANLRHPNILTPLAYHYRKEEKLLVSEYVSKGSLLYILHGDRGNTHAELTWPNRLKIIKGVAQGMGFLHLTFPSYPLPHGNLKSSNVLIGSDYEPLLSDYAFYPLVNQTPTAQCMFAFKSPEATLNQKVSPKTDVYCLGIVILEIVTGKYPSQYYNNQKGGTDVVQWVRSALLENREKELIDPEISASANESIGQMEKLLHIGAACTESEPEKRIDLQEAIRRIEGVSV